MSRFLQRWCRLRNGAEADRRPRPIRDESGIAAVEFAFILPLLLLLYVGTNTLMQAISAARGVTVLARTLSDLVSQQPPNVNLTDAVTQDMFNASTTVLAPFSTASLQMTLSNIEFVANASASSGTGYDAKTRWTVSFSNGTLRPCATAAGTTTPVLTPVANGTKPSSTTMPLGLYGAGFIIVADVSYTYQPTIGLFTWGQANGRTGTGTGIAFSRTSYMRPRETDNIRYTPGTASNTASICNIASPQVAQMSAPARAGLRRG